MVKFWSERVQSGRGLGRLRCNSGANFAGSANRSSSR